MTSGCWISKCLRNKSRPHRLAVRPTAEPSRSGRIAPWRHYKDALSGAPRRLEPLPDGFGARFDFTAARVGYEAPTARSADARDDGDVGGQLGTSVSSIILTSIWAAWSAVMISRSRAPPDLGRSPPCWSQTTAPSSASRLHKSHRNHLGLDQPANGLSSSDPRHARQSTSTRITSGDDQSSSQHPVCTPHRNT